MYISFATTTHFKHIEDMEQILQISINNKYLCEIQFNSETQSFYTDWTDLEENTLESFKINFDPEKSLKDWFDNMQNMNNCTFSNIEIKEFINYGTTINTIDEVNEFLLFKMGDLRAYPGEICVYQMNLTIAS